MATGTVRPVRIEDEIQDSYLDYAMSVIVSRALPDVRDGLKPVHRRILYAMEQMGSTANSVYKKSARIVGEVLGKYHPHGDTAVYDAMVRLAQDFSMRYPMVDGQGNFGSVDNDPPAAMRYTEARMSAIAREMLASIDQDTVDFGPNFDGSLQEPLVLPARIPNLLLNGASGIAVGMATNIPPHNLGELCDGLIHLIDNPEATVEDLTKLIPGPDFPTGGIIRGREGINSAYTVGRGKIVVQAKHHLEEIGGKSGRQQIVVDELPYQVNKASLVQNIAELVKDKRIEGISEIRDESDREGMRLVLELKRDAQIAQLVNNLFKHTALQSPFHANMLALVAGQPQVISLRDALQYFIAFRREVTSRRSRYDLARARERAHILEGFRKALDNLDAIIAAIRTSASAEAARENLMRDFQMSQAQAQAILDLQLRRLAALEQRKILEEYTEVIQNIAYLEDLLGNPRKVDTLLKEEFVELKKQYGDERRTLISTAEIESLTAEDLIPHEDSVVTISQKGYIKRMPRDAYRLQHRGGRGATGMVTREDDAVRHLLMADTHDHILFFTNRGRVFHLKCYDVPTSQTKTARGLPLINLVSMSSEEQVTALVSLPTFEAEDFFVFLTRKGEVKKVPARLFSAVRSTGIIAMDLAPKDELAAVRLGRVEDEVIVVTALAQAVRFSLMEMPSRSRTAGGVRAARLDPGDYVVDMEVVVPGAHLLTLSAKGFGKRTPLASYPVHHRGTQGVYSLRITDKTGPVVASRVVGLGAELMMVSALGNVLRTTVDSIQSMGRQTQGVIVWKLEEGDSLVSMAIGPADEAPAADIKKGPAPKRASPPEASPNPGPTKRGRAPKA